MSTTISNISIIATAVGPRPHAPEKHRQRSGERDSTTTKRFELLELPVDILLLIAEHLPTHKLSVSARTCRALHTLFTPVLNAHLISEDKPFFLEAILGREYDIIGRALANGANPNHRHLGGTVLFTAMYWIRDTVTGRMLLEAGADIHIRDRNGQTMVEAVASRRYWECVDLLVEFGAPAPTDPEYRNLPDRTSPRHR